MSGFTPSGRLFAAVAWTALLLATGCASAPRAPTTAQAAESVTFPDPAKASFPEGRFVNLENLRKVQVGMTKGQLYALLGTPHFGEGVFGVKAWNYIFEFHDVAGAAGNKSCQYQITFNADHLANAMYWKPESCNGVLAQAAPVASIAPQMPAAVASPGMQPIRLSADALFAFNRSDLTEQGRQNLSQLLQQVQHASRLQNILIIGYADRIGSESHNILLSKQRADAVERYLAEGGVPAMAMTSAGKGSDDPIVQCANLQRADLIQCLSPNRRVELSGAIQH